MVSLNPLNLRDVTPTSRLVTQLITQDVQNYLAEEIKFSSATCIAA